jgi:excisionase family DNA binding protein
MEIESYSNNETSQRGIALLSLSRAAKSLRIGRAGLDELIDKGLIRVLKIGKRRKIPMHELLRYQNDNLIQDTKGPSLSDKEVMYMLSKDRYRFNSGNTFDSDAVLSGFLDELHHNGRKYS